MLKVEECWMRVKSGRGGGGLRCGPVLAAFCISATTSFYF